MARYHCRFEHASQPILSMVETVYRKVSKHRALLYKPTCIVFIRLRHRYVPRGTHPPLLIDRTSPELRSAWRSMRGELLCWMDYSFDTWFEQSSAMSATCWLYDLFSSVKSVAGDGWQMVRQFDVDDMLDWKCPTDGPVYPESTGVCLPTSFPALSTILT